MSTETQALTISPYIIPVAIICSALIGFLAAWYNSLINRQSREISLQINEICSALDKLKSDAVQYWMGGNSRNNEILITSLLHSISLQLSYLRDSLNTFTTPRWKLWKWCPKTDKQNQSKLADLHKELHNLITGDDFGVAASAPDDLERCRRISAKIDRFKFYIRTYRKRY